MEAAITVFLQKGYKGASVDEIAALAGVSKQTMYKYFDDKEALFSEIVLGTIDQIGEPFYEAIVSLQEPEDLERDLRELARRLVAIVMQPRLLQLRRLVIGEAARFPELGRAYYERGPGRTVAALASSFERLSERGLLRVDDASVAASGFLWMAVSVPLNEAMLRGEDDRFSPSELDSFADEGVRVFMAAYGPAA
jgi:AcrR family transcriptional regulator